MTATSLQQTLEVAERAIDAVYEKFATIAPAAIAECPCCSGSRGVDVLLTTPLRQLSPDALWPYVSGAFYTVGGVDDFRYLLPRILEIAVLDPYESNDPAIVISKLGLAEWRHWSSDERQAVIDVIDAWFESALIRDAGEGEGDIVGGEVEAILCGAAIAGLPLQRWIIRLHRSDAALVLADLKKRFPDQFSGFWERAPEGFNELASFLEKDNNYLRPPTTYR